MQRRFRPLIGASVLVLACSGCHLAPTGLAPDLTGQQARSERADSDASSSSEEVQQAGFKSNQRKDRGQVKHASLTRNSLKSNTGEDISLEKLELLNAELRDATPEERLQWNRVAAKLDPTELEMALKVRKKPPEVPRANWGHTAGQGRATQISHTAEVASSNDTQRPFGHSDSQLPIVTPGTSTRSKTSDGSDPTREGSSNRMSLIVSDQLGSLETNTTPPQQQVRQQPTLPSPFGSRTEIGRTETERQPVSAENVGPAFGHLGAPQERPVAAVTDASLLPEPPPTLPSFPAALPTSPSLTSPSPTSPSPMGPLPTRPLPIASAEEATVKDALAEDPKIEEAVESLRDITELKSSLTSATWNEELRKLIDLAESDLAEMSLTAENRDEFVKKHVNLRMMQLVAGDPNKAIRAIPGIDASEQEFWQQVLWAMSEYFADRTMPNHKDRVTETLSDLRRAIHRMRSQANLQIKNMNFCSRISSFGVYEKVGTSRFQAGQQILIYAEIENFQSEEVVNGGSGVFKTRISSTLEIHESGDSAAISTALRKETFSPTVDMCASPRRDYFNAYTYVLPNDIPPGQYSLRLMVRDELGAGIATERLNFEVVP